MKTSPPAAGGVCALVVTYNRKELLLECLARLLAQTRPVDAVLLVDNASTDGTPAALAQAGYLPADLAAAAGPQSRDIPPQEAGAGTLRRPAMLYRRLAVNGGGAGGWHAGLGEIARLGYRWVWVMDDDTLPTPTALEELLAARERFPVDQRPELLASKVVWTDGQLHVMNFSNTPPVRPEDIFLAATYGAAALRSSSFVSLLLSVELVRRYGLPLADYFIWNEDTEYTARILRREFGVAAPASVALHKTPYNHVPATVVGGRFFYAVRNTLWMLWRTDSFLGYEKVRGTIGLVWRVAAYLKANPTPAGLWCVLRGLGAGLFTRPRGSGVAEGPQPVSDAPQQQGPR